MELLPRICASVRMLKAYIIDILKTEVNQHTRFFGQETDYEEKMVVYNPGSDPIWIAFCFVYLFRCRAGCPHSYAKLDFDSFIWSK